jgi:uncharacterized damage-inducible protein DinB
MFHPTDQFGREIMDKQALDGFWDQFRQKYGVYLRLLDLIPADRYQSQPVPGMRTAAELAVHVSGTIVRDIAQGVAKGSITADEATEAGRARDLDKPRLIAFARQCFDEANAAVARIGDAQLQAMVSTPWNMSWPGWVGFAVMNDEFVHHRGQLYVYARLLGIAPPFIGSYKENAPEYQPAGSVKTTG